jgi:hypothetical protein
MDPQDEDISRPDDLVGGQDDVEGHRKVSLDNDTEDDVEGHRRMGLENDTEDDVEGHRRMGL